MAVRKHESIYVCYPVTYMQEYLIITINLIIQKQLDLLDRHIY